MTAESDLILPPAACTQAGSAAMRMVSALGGVPLNVTRPLMPPAVSGSTCLRAAAGAGCDPHAATMASEQERLTDTSDFMGVMEEPPRNAGENVPVIIADL